MSDSGARKAFRDDSNHDAEHRSPTVEQFDAFELFQVDITGSDRLEPGAVGLIGLHGHRLTATKCNAMLTECHP